MRLGSRGIFGKRPGTLVTETDFVPKEQNDMIFSIICEKFEF